MHRFHFDPSAVTEGIVRLSPEESRHAFRVLRLKVGEVVELLDGRGGIFRGVAAEVSSRAVVVSLDRSQDAPPVTGPMTPVILALSLIRPERMETAIQKACEIGVASIVPVRADRSVVRLSNEQAASKIARWQKIVQESCKQCGRARAPEIAPAVDFVSFCRTVGPETHFLVPTLAVPGRSLREALGDFSKSAHRKIVVAIGPEGDFTEREIRAAVAQGGAPVHLGNAVLRAETAAIYCLSVIAYELPD